MKHPTRYGDSYDTGQIVVRDTKGRLDSFPWRLCLLHHESPWLVIMVKQHIGVFHTGRDVTDPPITRLMICFCVHEF